MGVKMKFHVLFILSVAFRVFKAHDQTIKHVDFYHAGSFISTGSSDRTVKLWDMKQPTPVHKYEVGLDFFVYRLIIFDKNN